MPAAQVDIRLLKAFRELVARRAKIPQRSDDRKHGSCALRHSYSQAVRNSPTSHFVLTATTYAVVPSKRLTALFSSPAVSIGRTSRSSKRPARFLDIANTSFEIIVGRKLDVSDGATLGASEFLSGIVESSNRKGVVTVLIAIDGQVGIKSLPDVNFVVADDNGYRMERPGDGTPALTRFGRPTVNNHLFVKFDEMAAEFAAAFQARATNCVKLVYAPDNKNVNSPTHIIGIDSVEPAELERFLIDQIHCPHKPVEMAAQPHTAPSDPK